MKKEVIQIFETLLKEMPRILALQNIENPVIDEKGRFLSELSRVNDYTFLVAVVLSAQSTDKGVNKATPALFEVASTPKEMLDLGLDGLKEYIKTIGLYNNKAKNIISLSQDLVDKFGGVLPQNREDLESLAGVGRKTANVVMNVLWDKPVVAVDTHVIRVSNRLGFSSGKDPVKIENDLNGLLDDKYKIQANHLLVFFGRYVCKARNPDCVNCPIYDFCNSEDKKV